MLDIKDDEERSLAVRSEINLLRAQSLLNLQEVNGILKQITSIYEQLGELQTFVINSQFNIVTKVSNIVPIPIYNTTVLNICMNEPKSYTCFAQPITVSSATVGIML